MELAICGYLDPPLTERLVITNIDEKAVLAVFDDFGDSSSSRCDRGKTKGQSLHQSHRLSFVS